MIDRQKALNEEEMEALGRARALRSDPQHCPGIRRYIQAVASKLTRDKGRLAQDFARLPGGAEPLAFACVNVVFSLVSNAERLNDGEIVKPRRKFASYGYVGAPVVYVRWEVARALYCEAVYHKATPFGKKALARIYENQGRGFKKLADAAARKAGHGFYGQSGALYNLARRITMELERLRFIIREQPAAKQWYYRLSPRIEAEFWRLREEFARPLWLPLLDRTPYVGGTYPDNPQPLMKRRRGMLHSGYHHPTVALESALAKIAVVPWRINEPVLSAVENLWGKHPSLGLPNPNVQESVPIPYPLPQDPQTKRQTLAVVHLERRKKAAALHRASRAVWVARRCRGHNVRLPTQADWRGRIYTLCTALTYQGTDLEKSLLSLKTSVYDEKASQCEGARLWGLKLANEHERRAWARDQEQEVERVRRLGPEETVDYWSQADDPWQFLAWCLDPSRITWLDGSANGLQHLALMAESKALAERVNLTPRDGPTDIYEQGLELLRPLLEGDIEGRAWLQSGLIDRKLAKSAIMTLPYGVTREGLRDQVEARLFPLGPRMYEVTQGYPREAVFYLVRKLQAMQALLLGPEVLEYLESLRTMARLGTKGARWATGAAWIEQAYVEPSSLYSALYGRISDPSSAPKISIRKQVAGILPNWVHSHDADHLVRVVTAPMAPPLAPVHDSFGCSPHRWGILRTLLVHQLAELYPEAAEQFDLRNAPYAFW